MSKHAYAFARGEEIVSSTGQRVRLSRPLDFLVVADHSDNMDFFSRLFAGDPVLLQDETGPAVRVRSASARRRLRRSPLLGDYAIGTVAGFWFVGRLAAF